MATDSAPLRDDLLGEALRSMELALELLDRGNAPPHIGAHLDLAICRLAEELREHPSAASARSRPGLHS